LIKILTMMNYEIEERKNKAKGQIGYGIMWFFLAALVAIIAWDQQYGMFYYLLVVAMVAAGVHKLIIGIKKYRRLSL